jgi:hypothetical protein
LSLIQQGSRSQGCQMVFFHTNNPKWVHFGGPWNRKGRCILSPFGNFVAILYVYVYFHVLVNCTEKNLATMRTTGNPVITF